MESVVGSKFVTGSGEIISLTEERRWPAWSNSAVLWGAASI